MQRTSIDVRGPKPTIFEYYRRSTGAPPNACWIVTGSRMILQTDWSLEPALVRNTLNKKFYLAWTDYNSSVASTNFSTSRDGVDWSSRPPVTTSTAIPRKPHMAFRDGRKYVVWEEQKADGKGWVIKSSKLD